MGEVLIVVAGNDNFEERSDHCGTLAEIVSKIDPEVLESWMVLSVVNRELVWPGAAVIRGDIGQTDAQGQAVGEGVIHVQD